MIKELPPKFCAKDDNDVDGVLRIAAAEKIKSRRIKSIGGVK